jgi:hypothetical protein
MFCNSKRAASLITFVFLIASAFSLPAHADKYQIFSLGDDFSRNLMEIDNAGNVAVIINCPIAPDFTCYDIYADGVFSFQTTDISQFQYTAGGSAPCNSVPAGVFFHCNNGHIAYFADLESLGEIGIFTGPDPVADFLVSTITSGLMLNALGDIAWIDTRKEIIFEAVDLTSRETPEPSTFVFLGTGVLGLAGVARRKFFFHS